VIGLLVLAQLVVIAHVPDTASVCASIEVSVAARVAGTVAPFIHPYAPSGNLELLKVSTSTRVERDGSGNPSSLTEATFVLAAETPGRLILPPFIVTAGSQHGAALAGPIEVHGGGTLPPDVIVRAWLDRLGKQASDTLFVGQQVDYVVDVQLNESARQRLRRNPTFFPPEMPGVLAYDLAAPAALTRVGRRCFETLSYRRALFPLFAGRTAIAPAALTYSLPQSTSYYSREESFELRTDSVRFIALDVPVNGRPVDFAGAVGDVAATTRVSTTSARMGDPVVVTLRLEGQGNVKLWPRPALKLGWASVANGEERVEVDTSRARVRGSKEFDWLVTPRQPGRQDVPALRYSYFDPERGAYDSAATQLITLDVASAALAEVDSTPVTRLGIRRTLRDEAPLPASHRPWYWLLLAIAPAPAALRRVNTSARRRTERRSGARRLRDAASRKEDLSPRALRRLYLEAIADRVPSTRAVVQPAALARALRLAGVTDAVAEAASALAARLDASAFSPAGTAADGALDEALSIVRAVDVEAIRLARGRGPARIVMLVGALALSAGIARAVPAGLTRTFSEGVSAYDRGAFTTSQRLFARVAARAPRAADAWANLGAAAWSRGDSASAARAWQRAIRLEPLDDETRDRLEAFVPTMIRANGYVPPVSIGVVAFAALACWLVAWSLLALPVRLRPPASRSVAGGILSVAIVLLLGALELNEQLEPGALGVLRVTRPLTAAPGSGSPLATGTIGETARLGAREGAWVHIAIDPARSGWVPASSMLLLDAPADQ
jgi:tetratricopeptide (TPR) repeat protein